MSFLFLCTGVEPDQWTAALKALEPELDIRIWPDTGPVEEIEYALVWLPPPGELKRFSNLRAIFSFGAGVEDILADPNLPADVPLTRLVEPGLAVGMREFVLWSVLHYHRRMPEYAVQQREKTWRLLRQVLPGDRRVGIMGLGVLGATAAKSLVELGFDVAGWSRSKKDILGVESYYGADALAPFLARTEILVCLLPLTAETRGILNATTLSQLPRGAYLINAARGGELVEKDLLAALDSGQIVGATLDVFATEPLPADHPFWTHPKVTVLPHAAADTLPESAAAAVINNLRRSLADQPLLHVVNRSKGY